MEENTKRLSEDTADKIMKSIIESKPQTLCMDGCTMSFVGKTVEKEFYRCQNCGREEYKYS